MFCAPVLSNSWLSWLSAVLTGRRGYEVVVLTWIFTGKVKVWVQDLQKRCR